MLLAAGRSGTASLEIGDKVAIIALVVSVIAVVVVMVQIWDTTRLNRKNQTFQKIKELEEMLYNDDSLKDIIKKIHLIENEKEAIGYKKALKMYEDSEQLHKIYRIINFFESLSLAMIKKNIDEKTFRQIFGKRMVRAYIKLHPFIVLIAGKSHNPRYEPYQHFKYIYTRFSTFYERENRRWTLKRHSKS